VNLQVVAVDVMLVTVPPFGHAALTALTIPSTVHIDVSPAYAGLLCNAERPAMRVTAAITDTIR